MDGSTNKNGPAFIDEFDAVMRKLLETGIQDIPDAAPGAPVHPGRVASLIREINTSLDTTRLCMKYTNFDNDCLRRENAALRKLLNELAIDDDDE